MERVHSYNPGARTGRETGEQMEYELTEITGETVHRDVPTPERIC